MTLELQQLTPEKEKTREHDKGDNTRNTESQELSR